MIGIVHGNREYTTDALKYLGIAEAQFEKAMATKKDTKESHATYEFKLRETDKYLFKRDPKSEVPYFIEGGLEFDKLETN